ncbi:sulfur carrier protein ThiS [Tamlana fucoidanivorans]|uniref:Sulfur carrier protein ThiS n=1 Tax=Allotamlana fucoidanivorans TaxID=2583814 RepID=A0A5C4SSX3_9FLAO|nr:sulfur carrier protein ThiS [Tamlana fucoidanivorans]TNJ47097.1 sulfur carrier protein ThiS [Tamlana fucoidanivorans]
MIKIKVNQCAIDVENNCDVFQLLEKIESPKEGIAVAINNKIVSKPQWSSQTFNDNDSILIIQATQGG